MESHARVDFRLARIILAAGTGDINKIVEALAKLPRDASGNLWVCGETYYTYSERHDGSGWISKYENTHVAGDTGDYYDPHEVGMGGAYRTPEEAKAGSEQ